MAGVRVGLVGYGNAAKFHVPALRQLGEERCELVAVCGRSRERAEEFARQWGIARAFGTMAEMLAGVEVDAVDLAVPNHVHGPHIIEAAKAGKHIICEKHLTGYFGEPETSDEELIGHTMPKAKMLERVLEEIAQIEAVLTKSGVRFGYAENWIYAPAFVKLRRLCAVSGGTIMRIEAEESHSGSPSVYAKRWRTAGGGSLVLKGSHPLGAVLQLKQWEGGSKFGRPIRPASVSCEVGNLTWIEAFKQEPVHYLKTDWQDVEDWGVVVLKFEDGSVAEIKAGDTTLGGVHNYLEAYLSNCRLRANINPNNACVAYAPDPGIFGDEYISEKIETKGGYTFPSPEEDWNLGYPQEMADFITCIAEGREAASGFLLARDTTIVLYAGYVAAEEGRRVDLRPYLG